MRQSAKLQVSRRDDWDVSRRPNTSQDVVETSLVVVVSSAGMTSTTGTDTRIGDGARAVTLIGGEDATRPSAVRSAIGRLQRVRAFMRVTRRATRSTCGRSVWMGGSAWLTPHGSRRESVTLRSDTGGPDPLTEDRQEPRSRCATLVVGAHCRWRECTERVTPCLPGRSDRAASLEF
jgi:hypothetical protein